MSSDPNKKSTRSFQCRDVLWETFEQMARELECSIDYLINESMKQYARQRSYSPNPGGRTPFPGQSPTGIPPQPPPPPPGPPQPPYGQQQPPQYPGQQMQQGQQMGGPPQPPQYPGGP